MIFVRCFLDKNLFADIAVGKDPMYTRTKGTFDRLKLTRKEKV